jgi:hypothetical protein
MGVVDTAVSTVRNFFGGASSPAPASTSRALTVFQAPSKTRPREPGWIPAPPKVSRATPIGAPGTLIRGGRISNEEWNTNLENERGYGEQSSQGVYDEMRKTDPDIRRALQLLKSPLRAARYTFEPVDTTPIEKEIADFCSHVFFELNGWKSRVLPQALLKYDFGFQIFEAVEKPIKVSRSKFPNLPHEKGPGRPGETETVDAVMVELQARATKTAWRFQADPQNQERLGAFVQKLNDDDSTVGGYRTIPADRIVRFTHDQEAGNFGGVSALRYVVKPFRYLERGERTDVVRHERQNNGTPVFSLPENGEGVTKEDLDRAEKILKSVGQSEKGFIIEPPGWKFRWETSGEGQGTNVGEAITRWKRAIADAIVAGFITLGNGDVGSYAMADTHADFFRLGTEAEAKTIEDVFNVGPDGWSVIARLVELNYGPRAAYPKLKVTDLKGPEFYIALLTSLGNLIRYGAVKPSKSIERFALEKFDLPDDDDDENDEDSVDEEPGEATADEVPPVNATGAAVTPANPAAPAQPAPKAPGPANGGSNAAP